MTAWMCIVQFQKIAPKMSPKFKMSIELAPRWSREKYCSKRLAHLGAGGTHLSSRDILPDERREKKGRKSHRFSILFSQAGTSPGNPFPEQCHFCGELWTSVRKAMSFGKQDMLLFIRFKDWIFLFGRGKSRPKNWHTEGFAYIRCLVPRDDIYRPPKTTPPPTSSRSGASPRERHSWPLWYLWWNRSDLAVGRQGIHRAWKEKEKK